VATGASVSRRGSGGTSPGCSVGGVADGAGTSSITYAVLVIGKPVSDRELSKGNSGGNGGTGAMPPGGVVAWGADAGAPVGAVLAAAPVAPTSDGAAGGGTGAGGGAGGGASVTGGA
jgi:hypothetical protein